MAATAIRCRTVSDLRQVLTARRRALGWTQLELDYRAGTQDQYAGKLEAATRGYGDLSLSCIMGALGFELLVVERPEPRTPKAVLGNLRENLDRLGLDLIIVAKPRQVALPAPRHYADRRQNGELP